MIFEHFADFLAVLIGNQSHGDLGLRFCRKDGLGSFTRVPSPDPVDVQGGADPYPLQGSISRFPLDFFDPQLLLILPQVKRDVIQTLTIC